MPKYVPPHLRTRIGSPSSPSEYSVSEIRHQFDLDSKFCTLNASSSSPEQLAFIALYRGQHKDWPPHISVHSNISLLPATSDEDVSMSINPQTTLYPLFIQPATAHWGRAEAFVFAGYHAITKIAYLEPGSKELVALLSEKFMRADGRALGRWEAQWRESLAMRWAVVSLKPVSEDVARGRGLGNPMVPLRPGLKSVTERLAELRRDKLSA